MNTTDLGPAVRDLVERVLALGADRDEMKKDYENLANAVLYLAHQLDEIHRIALEVEVERDLDLETRRRRGRQTARDLVKVWRRHH